MDNTASWMQTDSEMTGRIRSMDWSATPLGPIESWPASLHFQLRTLLQADVPMFLWWGTGLIQFYNDAYIPLFGQNGKHPSALGQRADECWQDMWFAIEHLFRAAWRGSGFWDTDVKMELIVDGVEETTYWTFSYLPVPGDDFKTAGILVSCLQQP